MVTEIYFFFLKAVMLFVTELGSVWNLEVFIIINIKEIISLLFVFRKKNCKPVLLAVFSMQLIKQKGNVVLEEKSRESPYLFISIFSYVVIFVYFYLCKIVLSLIPMKEIKLKHQCHVALWGVRYSSQSQFVLLYLHIL